MLTDSLSTKSKLDSWNPDFDLILETAIRENSDDYYEEAINNHSMGIDAYVEKNIDNATDNEVKKTKFRYPIKDGFELEFNGNWSAAPEWVNEAFEQQKIDFKGSSSDIKYVLYPNDRIEEEEFGKYPYITISYLELNTDMTHADFNEILETAQKMTPSVITIMDGALSEFIIGTSLEGFYKDVENRRYAYSTISKVNDIGEVLTVNLNQYTSSGLIRISFTCLEEDLYNYQQDISELLIGLN